MSLKETEGGRRMKMDRLEKKGREEIGKDEETFEIMVKVHA